MDVQPIKIESQPDKKGIAYQKEFERIDQVIREKEKANKMRYIISNHYAWTMIEDRWAKTPDERQAFWVQETYEGTDGKSYERMRKPTEGELDLLIMLFAIQKFVND